MTTNKKQVLIRINQDIHEKLKFISEKNNRSVSNQLMWLILQFISNYESINGQILSDDSGSQKNVGVVQQNNNGMNFFAIDGGVSYGTISR